MNDITRPMGFIFRDDLLFGFERVALRASCTCRRCVPHPIVQHMPPMDFAVSCSIDPGSSHGRAAIANTGLWSMGPEYHADNFHPVPAALPGNALRRVHPGLGGLARTGPRHGLHRLDDLLQLLRRSAGQVGTDAGHDRVAQPRQSLARSAARGCCCWDSAAGWRLLDGRRAGLSRSCASEHGERSDASGATWLVLLAAGTCGWVVGLGGGRRRAPLGHARARVPPSRSAASSSTAPPRPCRCRRAMIRKAAARATGCWSSGLPGSTATPCAKKAPRRSPATCWWSSARAGRSPRSSASELARYVADGGKLLVIDSPENANSTANSLLWPFGLSIHHDRTWKGKLTTGGKLPAVDVARACEVAGGQPVARLDKYPVAATVRHGKGSVMAVGFGSLWNDAGMGETWTMEPGVAVGSERSWVAHATSPGWMLEPNATVKARYDVLFGLLRPFFEDKPLPAASSSPGDKPKEDKELRLKNPARRNSKIKAWIRFSRMPTCIIM